MQYKRTDFIAIWTLIGIFLIAACTPQLENTTLNLAALFIAISSTVTLALFALLWFNDYPREICMMVIYAQLTTISAILIKLCVTFNWVIPLIPLTFLVLILLWCTLYLPYKQ